MNVATVKKNGMSYILARSISEEIHIHVHVATAVLVGG